jgi:hypothetical protein
MPPLTIDNFDPIGNNDVVERPGQRPDPRSHRKCLKDAWSGAPLGSLSNSIVRIGGSGTGLFENKLCAASLNCQSEKGLGQLESQLPRTPQRVNC